MWFVISFTGMTWATYATFCESHNPSAQTTSVDCLFPQTVEESCICIPCRVWLWDLSVFPFLIQYLNCYFGGCFKPPEVRPGCHPAWPLLEISTSWKSEEPRWESLLGCVFLSFRTERRSSNAEDILSTGFSNRTSDCPISWRNRRGVRFTDPLP